MPIRKRTYVQTAERVLGRPLPCRAVVHHVDRNRKNGSNDNLAILQNQGEHLALHRRLRVLRAGGDPWAQQICCTCQTLKPLDSFVRDSRYWNGRRSECQSCSTIRSQRTYNTKHGRPADWRESPEQRSERNRTNAVRRWSQRADF